MPARRTGPSRRQQILQALAHMLEACPGARITTANLAKEVGVSEAALYRHFPSKAKMFEGLLEFIEDTLFSRISAIIAETFDATAQIEKILVLVLGFAEKNPGISRVLNGDALTGETERLRARSSQLFDRLETQLKQIIREAEMREGLRPAITSTALANLITAYIEGRVSQFVRSGFKQRPTADWQQQWQLLEQGLWLNSHEHAASIL
ncbi:MAG TPA: nucleoid occlusion factor SlmA [Pseudomonadales bacterium]